MSSKSMTTGARRGIATALLAALAVAAPASSQAAPPKLVATVGPGLTISLKTAAGKKVTTLQRGTYVITVKDQSRFHDFRLRGPVSKTLSGVAAVGTKTVTVRLVAGKYQFVCAPHASAMKGSFSVR